MLDQQGTWLQWLDTRWACPMVQSGGYDYQKVKLDWTHEQESW